MKYATLTAATVVASALSIGSGALVASASPSSSAAAPGDRMCFGKPATIVADGGTVYGTAGNDVIVATDKTSSVIAKGGDDRVCGALVVQGGNGKDRIRFGGSRDRHRLYLHGGAGADEIRLQGYLSTNQSGPDRGVFGGAGPDLLVGSQGHIPLDGGGGADTIIDASGSNWSLVGGRGNDTITGGGGQDIISGGPGVDLLYGKGASDEMSGGFRAYGGDGWDICYHNIHEYGCEADDWV